MSESEKAKKFRSPPYPSIGLGKAIDRARQLYAKAQHHPVSFKVLADAWGYAEKSSGLWGTAAALIHYGLLEDDGTGKARKFKLCDVAQRIIRDAEPNSAKRLEAIRRVALNPVIFAELWGKFKNPQNLSDAVLINYLTLDRQDAGKAPFSDSSAEDAVKTYRETIASSGLLDTDTVSDENEEQDAVKLDDPVENPMTVVKVGDFVQWTISGSDQFKSPKKVEWISDAGDFLRVQGSPTGIAIDQVTVTDPPSPPKPDMPMSPGAAGPAPKVGDNDINVYLSGHRLQITADVDAEGLQRLKKILEKYDEILKLLQ